MKAYSKDLPQKIVDALGRGMSKAEAAYIFGVGISTLKRYVAKAQRGEPLEPAKKAPGKQPKKMDERLRKLLEEDLKERPFVTLRERCDYVEAISGVSVSRSTMCRAIARRIGSTRKKGDAKRHGARRVSEGRLAGDGGRRARSQAALVLVDEMGVCTSLAPLYTVTLQKANACACGLFHAIAAGPRHFWPRSPLGAWARRWPSVEGSTRTEKSSRL